MWLPSGCIFVRENEPLTMQYFSKCIYGENLLILLILKSLILKSLKEVPCRQFWLLNFYFPLDMWGIWPGFQHIQLCECGPKTVAIAANFLNKTPSKQGWKMANFADSEVPGRQFWLLIIHFPLAYMPLWDAI